jgi:hypothetical protein
MSVGTIKIKLMDLHDSRTQDFLFIIGGKARAKENKYRWVFV